MKIINHQIAATVIKPRANDAHKGTFGRITLIGGLKPYHGAIILAATAAVYGGSGLVTVVTDSENISSLNTRLPEAIVVALTDDYLPLLANQDVIVIGPGLGETPTALKILTSVLQQIKPTQALVIDGSALTLLATHHLPLPTTALTVLTPHQMEWQRLSGIPISEQTPVSNQAVVDNLGVTVIVKKNHSQLYQPNQEPQQILVGGPYQATGGMGDTLAGLIGCFLGQFGTTSTSVAAALYLHSAVADELAKKQYVVLPSQISAHLPVIMAQLSSLGITKQ